MRLLIIGSLGGQIGAASQIAIARGAEVGQADDIPRGLERLRTTGADLVMVDVALDVEQLILGLAAEHMTVPVVACGTQNDSRAAVRAIKAGAREYIPLPPEPELIAAVLQAVTEDNRDIVFRDPSMQRVMKMAEQVAPSEASILITGESGTGKELMARFVHAKSRRAKARFVAVNCAAIPDNLLESELFGHEKGAFTGAVARRIGRFEEATGGTLLLDEISEMDVRLQAKLLRAIQEKEIDRVGSNTPVKVNVRLIATSNRNLQDAVRQGHFREDLYFRLNVVNLALPPLRERPADIEALADHFALKYAELNDMPARPLSQAARALLRAQAWPGNVRELENTIHRAVLLAQGSAIEPEAILLPDTAPRGPAIPPAGGGGATPGSAMANAGGSSGGGAAAGDATSGLVGRTVADVERDLIIETLKHTLGNRTHAANILGISIRTLRNKLKLYADQGVPVPPPAGDAEAHP
ncbi:sigma-54-dependent transcriptional regulator [Caenispirillum bisanense]|uniref:Two component, sigma54 specific, transcriptional regulator, Fis family n=1 Tax=Caenispirillum bisanense TaxID=414052 RepID=A0A286H0Y2_9PROT|nr:sigma-54 dependent transcriptional regulator [Caenispirillum bisanense]SOE01450.1 two component, sigma54 specific, transcriptional regulator, Fis family [Caenispirillum bisanense]